MVQVVVHAVAAAALAATMAVATIITVATTTATTGTTAATIAAVTIASIISISSLTITTTTNRQSGGFLAWAGYAHLCIGGLYCSFTAQALSTIYGSTYVLLAYFQIISGRCI